MGSLGKNTSGSGGGSIDALLNLLAHSESINHNHSTVPRKLSNKGNLATSSGSKILGSIGNNGALRSKGRTYSSGSNSGSQVHSPSSESAPSNANNQQITTRSRSRSITKALTPSHGVNLYSGQERAYLRKIKNPIVDDYYTKGISDANDDFKEADANDDEDEELEDANGNSDLLVDMDDEKYQIDVSLAFAMMKRGNTNLNFPNKQIAHLSKDIAEDPAVLERLQWQSMLSSVLTGDVVTSEKTKIIDSHQSTQEDSFLHATYKENLWFGVRAKLFNRTLEGQKKVIAYRRTLVDQLLEDVLKYEITYNDPVNTPPRKQVIEILDRYDKSCELWKTLEDMRNDKPICRTEEFQNRIDALNAWLSITDAIERETKSLRLWIGNDELDIGKSPVDERPLENDESLTVVKKIFDEDNKSLAERLMKEKDVYYIFKQRIFIPLSPWMIKSKSTYFKLGHMFEELKLPDYIDSLIQICIIPMKLIKEIIKVRLLYAKKLQNPTLMMIDQMIEDFRTYISISLEVKIGITEYCDPGDEKSWLLSDFFEGETLDFNAVVLDCVRYFLVLLNKKLLDSSRSSYTFRTFKEPEELEETWNYLKWLGNYIDGGSMVVSESISTLTLKLIHRLLSYFNHQIRSPPCQINGSSDLIRWYSSTTENFGQLRRKLARFTGEISRDFTNSIIFDLSSNANSRIKSFLDVLKASNHFLVFTGTVEKQGIYFFASPELLNNSNEILRIINGSYVGNSSKKAYPSLEFVEFMRILQEHKEDKPSKVNINSNDAFDLSYVLALCPPKPIVWDGNVITLNLNSSPINDVKVGQLLLISKLPYYELNIARDKFLDIIHDYMNSDFDIKLIEQRCSLSSVHLELTKVNRLFYKMSLAVLDSVKVVREKCRIISQENVYRELINNYFIYARDYGKNSVKNLDSSRKPTVIMKLIQLSIEWVSFICDDCVPTDRKTFRWCVLALEFAMDMTRGFNVLVLSDDQFSKLKLKVARCMSLLISHFDIMGARSSEAEKKKMLKWSSQRHKIEHSSSDDSILTAYREDVMAEINEIEQYRRELQEQLQSIGHVLDVTDLEYQFVTLLASSFSSVSIRWQKGKFIGGGTFGNVYAAVNLDTGGVMAVKEIRFHDSQTIKNIVPSIKDEMTVLEMLNHPNVVQYYGVEVHRDKVYIFMEFCEGGSLSNLLTHGRIEDEMVIQIYTLQMLEGLAYLHQSGVVHRDIKPENILLDHNGVIKFVDFGAAKVIAISGRTRNSESSNASQSLNGNGREKNLNSMTGTPMYMSPEVITGSFSDKNGVVDIWSLGCCVLEMATGRRPWANLDNEWAIMYHIAAGHKPQLPSADQLSEPGRKFLSRCLVHDPKKRPSAVELLNDPWIIQIKQIAFGSSESSTTPISETSGEIQM